MITTNGAAATTVTPSFRAVPDHQTLHVNLGALANLPGRWSGTGFNLIARPDFQGHNDIFLELNATRETLEFQTIGSPIPNRGSRQNDIDLFGVHYLQTISEQENGGALHLEPGIWVNVPRTTVPADGPTIARLATIPHGDAVNAQGTSRSIDGPPDIRPANTVPFPVGGTPPPPGSPNGFPEYNLSVANAFRTRPTPPGVTQAMVTDPNSLLREVIAHQTITHTEVLIVSTRPHGGIENIPFVVQNADAAQMEAIFWIEELEHNGRRHLQMQYTQTVLLNFLGLSWPHVSVATLTKTF